MSPFWPWSQVTNSRLGSWPCRLHRCRILINCFGSAALCDRAKHIPPPPCQTKHVSQLGTSCDAQELDCQENRQHRLCLVAASNAEFCRPWKKVEISSGRILMAVCTKHVQYEWEGEKEREEGGFYRQRLWGREKVAKESYVVGSCALVMISEEKQAGASMLNRHYLVHYLEAKFPRLLRLIRRRDDTQEEGRKAVEKEIIKSTINGSVSERTEGEGKRLDSNEITKYMSAYSYMIV